MWSTSRIALLTTMPAIMITPMYASRVKLAPRPVEDQEDADQRHRHGEQHDEGLAQRLEERGRDHEDEEQREREHAVDLLPLLGAPAELAG
jgi:hypothetical protein